VNGNFRPHFGLDIHASEGSWIVSADRGIVTYAGPYSRLNFVADSGYVVEDTLSYTIDTTIGGIDTIPFQLDLQDVFRFHAGVAGRIGMQKRYIGVD